MPVVDLGPAQAEDEKGVVDLGPVETGEYEDTTENAANRAEKTWDLAASRGVPMDFADKITFQQMAADLEKQRRALIKSTPWVTRDADNDFVVTEQEAREQDAEEKEFQRALKAGEIEPTLREVKGMRIVVPNRIVMNRSLLFAYINIPSFRKAIDADPNILDGVSFAGPESDKVTKLYNEMKPVLQEVIEQNKAATKHPLWSDFKGAAKGVLRAPSGIMRGAMSSARFNKREEELAILAQSNNLSDRIAAKNLGDMSQNAWLSELPGILNAPAAIWNITTLGIAPVPTLQFTPEQRGMTAVFSLAALMIPHSPAHFLFKIGRSGVGSVGTVAFDRFATRFPAVGGAIATVVSKPFINRLAAIPVEFAKLKGGQLSFAIFSPANLKRVNAGEHPIAIASEHFTSWFNIDPTTALFATVFGFAKGLKLDTPAGRAAQQARQAALKQLGLKSDATNADIRLAMGQWGKVQSTLVAERIPVQVPKPLPVPVVTTKLISSLKTSLKTQKAARKVVAKAQSIERGKRAGRYQESFQKFRAQGDDVPTATRKAMAQLKGQLTDAEIPPEHRPQLSKTEWDTMHQKIVQTFPDKATAFMQIRATAALEKIKAGQVLQDNEIHIIADLFGDKLATQLVKQFGAAERAARLASDILAAPRTLMAGGDVSFVGRQLLPVLHKDVGDLLTLRNINLKRPWDSLIFAQASAKNILSFFSGTRFKRTDKQIQSHPRYLQAKSAGMEFLKFGKFARPGETAEEFAARRISKWPLIRQGNRAAVAGTNWARLKMFDRIVGGYERRGISLTPQALSKIVNQVHDMTGRAGIPKGRVIGEIFDISNKVFFSPRYALSKIKNVVTLHHTLSRDSHIRAEGFRTLIGQVATTTATVAIARMFGADVDLDPRSTNFLKAKWGNKRYDLLPGEGQVIRFFARMALGQTTTAAGHVKRADRRRVMLQFLKSKSAPIVNMIRVAWTGREYSGKPIKGISGWMKETFRNFTFLWLQDGVDAFADEYGKEGSTLNALAKSTAPAGAAWIGVGVQVYPDTARTAETLLKDELAQEAFGKNWIDLAPIQVSDLVDQFQEELDGARQAVDVEIQERADFDFASRMLKEAAEAGQEVVGMLTEEPKTLMKFAKETLGFGVSIQRAIGRDEWIMNDERFRRYQKLTAKYLDEELTDLLKSPEWATLPDADKKIDISIAVEVSKTQARLDVMDEADDEALEEKKE